MINHDLLEQQQKYITTTEENNVPEIVDADYKTIQTATSSQSPHAQVIQQTPLYHGDKTVEDDTTTEYPKKKIPVISEKQSKSSVLTGSQPPNIPQRDTDVADTDPYVVKRIQPQQTPASMLVDHSTYEQLDKEKYNLIKQNLLDPSDQLIITTLQLIEKHLSVVPHIAYTIDLMSQSDPISDEMYQELLQPTSLGMFETLKMHAAYTHAKYDPISQIINFIKTGETPKQKRDEISAQFPDKDRHEFEKRVAHETGTSLSGVRLLHSSSEDVMATASTYQSQMLNIAKAQLDTAILSARNLVAIRMAMGVDKDVFNYEQLYDPGLIGRIFESVKQVPQKFDNLINHIPGISAVYEISKTITKLPLQLSRIMGKGLQAVSEMGEYVRMIPYKYTDWMTKGIYSLMRDETKFEKELGIYETDQEAAYSFLGRGLPDAMGQIIGYQDLQVKFLRNIYHVLRDSYGITGPETDLDARPMAWDAISRQFVEEDKRDDLRIALKRHYVRDQLGGSAIINQIKSLVTGQDVREIEEDKTQRRLERQGLSLEDLEQRGTTGIRATDRITDRNILHKSPGTATALSGGLLGALTLAPLLPILGPAALGILGAGGLLGSFRHGYQTSPDITGIDERQEMAQHGFQLPDTSVIASREETDTQISVLQQIRDIVSNIHDVLLDMFGSMKSMFQIKTGESQLMLEDDQEAQLYTGTSAIPLSGYYPGVDQQTTLSGVNVEQLTVSPVESPGYYPGVIQQPALPSGVIQQSEPPPDEQQFVLPPGGEPTFPGIKDIFNEIKDFVLNKEERSERLSSYYTGVKDALSEIKNNMIEYTEKTREGGTFFGRIVDSLFSRLKTWMFLGLGAAGLATMFLTSTGRDILGSVGEAIMSMPTLGLSATAITGATTGFLVGKIPGAIAGGLLGTAFGLITPLFSEDVELGREFYQGLADIFKDGLPRAAATGVGVISGATLGMTIGAMVGGPFAPLTAIKGGIVGALIGGALGFLSGKILDAMGHAIQDDGSFSAWEFAKRLILSRPGHNIVTDRELEELADPEKTETGEAVAVSTELMDEIDKRREEIAEERRERFQRRAEDTLIRDIREDGLIRGTISHLNPLNVIRRDAQLIKDAGSGIRDISERRQLRDQESDLEDVIRRRALEEDGHDVDEIIGDIPDRDPASRLANRMFGGGIYGLLRGESPEEKYERLSDEAMKSQFGTSDIDEIRQMATEQPQLTDIDIGGFATGGYIIPKQYDGINAVEVIRGNNVFDEFSTTFLDEYKDNMKKLTGETQQIDFRNVLPRGVTLKGIVGELGPEQFNISRDGIEIQPIADDYLSDFDVRSKIDQIRDKSTTAISDFDVNSIIDQIRDKSTTAFSDFDVNSIIDQIRDKSTTAISDFDNVFRKADKSIHDELRNIIPNVNDYLSDFDIRSKIDQIRDKSTTAFTTADDTIKDALERIRGETANISDPISGIFEDLGEIDHPLLSKRPDNLEDLKNIIPKIKPGNTQDQNEKIIRRLEAVQSIQTPASGLSDPVFDGLQNIGRGMGFIQDQTPQERTVINQMEEYDAKDEIDTLDKSDRLPQFIHSDPFLKSILSGSGYPSSSIYHDSRVHSPSSSIYHGSVFNDYYNHYMSNIHDKISRDQFDSNYITNLNQMTRNLQQEYPYFDHTLDVNNINTEILNEKISELVERKMDEYRDEEIDAYEQDEPRRDQPIYINNQTQQSQPIPYETLKVQNDVEEILMGQIDLLFGMSSLNFRKDLIDYTYGNKF